MIRGSVTVATLSVLSALPLAAQLPGVNKTVMPIDVAAKPSKLIPSGTVTLSGSTGLMGSKSSVTIQIISPNGKPATPITTQPRTDGSYAATFSSTQDAGVYNVAVTAPDGKGKAATTFTVVAAGVIPAEVANQIEQLLDASRQIVIRTRTALESQPMSPPRNQALAKLDAIHQQLQQAPTQVAKIKTALTQGFEARKKIADPLPEWDQYLAELGEWQNTAEAAQERVRKEARSTSAEAERCGELQQIADQLASASEVINISQIPGDKTLGYWLDKIPAGLASRGLAPTKTTNTEKFGAVQGLKLSAAIIQGPKGWVLAVAGLLLDVTQFLVSEHVDKYCVKFEGPIKGTFVGEAITRAGEKFWSYTIALDGKVVLMYPKGAASGKALSLVGTIEGAGDFSLRSNPAPINRLVPGVVLFFKAKAPLGGRFLEEVGSGMGGFAPHSYRIPLKGILAGDSIVLSVQPASFDFADVIKGHLIWVIMPMGAMWPEIVDAPIQFQKAQPIFERVIRRHPVLKIKKEGSYMVARGEFARDTTSADRTAHVTTQLTLKACNPGCVPLPLNPSGKKQQ